MGLVARVLLRRPTRPKLGFLRCFKAYSTSTAASSGLGSYVCYVLRSTKSERTYVGVTNSMPRRLRQHNGEITGGARYTQMGRPWRLAFMVKGFENKSQALQFEWAVKNAKPKRQRLKGRAQSMGAVLRRERWTNRAPESNAVPLLVRLYRRGLSGENQAKLGEAVGVDSLPAHVTASGWPELCR